MSKIERDEGTCPCGFIPRHVYPDECVTYTWQFTCSCDPVRVFDAGEKCPDCGTAVGYAKR